MEMPVDSVRWRRMVRRARTTLSRAWRLATGNTVDRPFVESLLCAASVAGGDAAGGRGAGDNVEDAYPLSPLQHSMLMHSLEVMRFGVDIEQILCELREDVHVPSLRLAWQRAVERHPILRTVFRWEGEGGPRQIVLRRVTIPWAEADWGGLSARERRQRFDDFLKADRERGFDLAAMPALRLTLVREENRLYRLCWTIHHLIMDGRMLVLLLSEVFSSYEAVCRGEESPAVAAPSFRSYIDWLERKDWSDAQAYWRRTLKGFHTSTPLTVSRVPPRTLAPAQMRGEQELTLSAEVTGKLKTWARANDLTPTTLVQGAWAVLLARYSGEQDVVFGTIRACRRSTVSDADRIVGPCINTVPVRVRVRPDRMLLPWLKELRDQWITLREHENTPLPMVRGWSDVPRSQSLFQTLVNFQDPSWDAELLAQGGNWDRRGLGIVSQPGLPLVLDGYGGRQIQIKLLYDRRHLDDATIRRMSGHLIALMEGMAADPDRRLADLPLLSRYERQQVLITFNQSKTTYPRHECVHRLFEAQARSTPRATALVFDAQTLTYRELNQKANQVARFLRRHGVRCGTMVGICVERSLEMVIGMLGILKAGGAYVPLDPAYPRGRLTFMLADTQIPVLLTQQRLGVHLRVTEQATVCLDSDWPAIAGENTDDLDSEAGADDLAYVIYTSGSSGRPKGVCVPHRGIVRLVKDTNYVHLDANEVLLQFSPISFDASTFEIWGALLNGGRLAIFPPHRPSLEELGRAIKHQGVTTLWLTAALFQHMVDQCLDSLRGVRQLLAGGDVLSVTAARKVLEELPGCRLINGYGPTENTTFTCCHSVTELAHECASIPIGQPIANSTAYVLDQDLQPVPIGVSGELWTGGDGVARGYLNAPDLTAERFLPDLFSGEPGARMYRTGDQGRWLPDGNLEFLGRLDQQVKIRGFRVELGEIETVLLGHPAVSEAVVVAREDTPGDRRLVAYVVPRGGPDLAAETMRGFLRQKLPEYMVPSAVVLLPALPLTANGKVDRHGLPQPLFSAWERGAPDVRPRTVTEEIVAGIWADVLKVEAVGGQDRFFELGGDSLLAMQVIVRIKRAMELDLPVRMLFDKPTLAEFCEQIAIHGRSAASRPRPAITAAPRDRPLPLSLFQEWMWQCCKADSTHRAFKGLLWFRIMGPLDVPLLERSLHELIRRHETMRTTLVECADGTAQVIGPAETVRLAVIDVSGSADIKGEVQRVMDEEDRRRVNPMCESPLRVTLLRCGPAHYRLLLAVHHIAYDSSLDEVFFPEWGLLYDAFRRGAPSPLGELPLQYADFAVWQRRLLQDAELLSEHVGYWKKQLAGAPLPLPLPWRRPDAGPAAAPDVKESVQRVVLLLPDRTGLLKALARREGTTPFTTLLAAFQALLSRATGQRDLTVGSYFAYRNQPEFEGIVGFRTNLVPLRTDLSGDPTFLELLGRVRAVHLAASAHQDVPFSELTRALHTAGCSMPPIQALFSYVRTDHTPLRLPGVRVGRRQILRTAMPSGFSLTIVERTNHRLVTGAVFDAGLYNPACVRKMLHQFKALVEKILADPARRLSELLPI